MCPEVIVYCIDGCILFNAVCMSSGVKGRLLLYNSRPSSTNRLW